MKQVVIKSMKLVNFKGLRDFSTEFNASVTNVLGKNGSGKTTVFDAFTWLMFGKDSEDRKSFNVKTLDEKGVAIPKLPHEVSAVIVVNGEEINLCRRFNEKWTKKRGSATEEFTGHEEERLYNDVPMSVKDWSDKINSICSEQVFKFITNPLYFSSQKSDAQRAMLFKMAGTISDDEIAESNEDFKKLLASITGKTLEEYKREIAAKKRRINEDIAGIPERIDERKRDMPVVENWLSLDAELSEKQNSLAEIEEAMTDKAEAYKVASNERLEVQKKISDLKQKILNREFDIKNTIQADYNKLVSEQKTLSADIQQVELDLARENQKISGYRNELDEYKQKRDVLISEWREIKSRQLVFKDGEFVCPTCNRPLEIEDIEKKQNEMTAAFNAKKATELEENTNKGLGIKAKMEKTEQVINECEKRVELLRATIDQKRSNPIRDKSLVAPNATNEIETDDECKKITAEIEELEKSVQQPIDAPDTDSLKQHKDSVSAEIDEIKKRLAKKETIDKNNARITELENQLREQSNELASLEGIEFTMAAFSKARVKAIENRINGLFSIVKFKMFEQQINGGEVETCEATVNGVPYSDLNNAMKINAGLDIINAICKAEDISAPIFIDNAESVNQLLTTASQMIRLVVTEDDKLIIQ